MSTHYGLCQLIFLLLPTSHSLQLQLYQMPDDSYQSGNSANSPDPDGQPTLRMNREICLTTFKIEKPLLFRPEGGLASSSHVQYGAEKNAQLLRESKRELKELQQAAAYKVLKVIRRMKKKFSGDIYDDFYSYGAPCSTADTRWKRLAVHLLPRPELEQMIRSNLMHTIQVKYYQSTAYVHAEQLRRQVKKKAPLEKTVDDQLRSIVLLQRTVRKFLKQRDSELQKPKSFRQRAVLLSFQKRFRVVNPSACCKVPEVYLRVVMTYNTETLALTLEGMDLNPDSKRRCVIHPDSEIPCDQQMITLIKQNKDFLKELIKVHQNHEHEILLHLDGSVFRNHKAFEYVDEMRVYKQKKGDVNVEALALQVVRHGQDGGLPPSMQGPSKEELSRQKTQKNYTNQIEKMQRLQLGNIKVFSAKKQQLLDYSHRNRYSSIFERRKIRLAQEEQTLGPKFVAKDRAMARFRVRNSYEYAVLKIQ